jgi:hypothetical protein
MAGFGVDRDGGAAGTGSSADGIAKAIVDVKGDLIAATAADTVARLAAGANDTRLVADSAQTTGLKYVADTTNAAIAAKGDLLVGTAAKTLAAHAVSTDGYRLQAQSGATDGLQYLPPDLGFSLLNGYLDWTVAASALTCAIKTWAGTDPSTTDPVYALVRSATATTGLPSLVKITAANSVVVSSGSTLGTRTAVPARVWAVLFDDAGTYRLGVINCLTTVAGAGAGSDVTAIYPLSGWGIASSTAEGGAGAADNAQTFYTGTAVTSKPYAVLGYATFEAGQAAAGTWATAASRKHLWGRGEPLPGQVIQVQRNDTGASSTGTTTIPLDDTIPQNTEGDQYMTQAITPTSAANVLAVTSVVNIASNVATGSADTAALFQDAIANALKTNTSITASGDFNLILPLDHRVLAAGTAATTFKVRAGSQSAGTTTFNGRTGSRLYGGTMNSFLQVLEIMA